MGGGTQCLFQAPGAYPVKVKALLVPSCLLLVVVLHDRAGGQKGWVKGQTVPSGTLTRALAAPSSQLQPEGTLITAPRSRVRPMSPARFQLTVLFLGWGCPPPKRMVNNLVPNPSGLDGPRATSQEPYKNSAGPQGSGLGAPRSNQITSKSFQEPKLLLPPLLPWKNSDCLPGSQVTAPLRWLP